MHQRDSSIFGCGSPVNVTICIYTISFTYYGWTFTWTLEFKSIQNLKPTIFYYLECLYIHDQHNSLNQYLLNLMSMIFFRIVDGYYSHHFSRTRWWVSLASRTSAVARLKKMTNDFHLMKHQLFDSSFCYNDVMLNVVILTWFLPNHLEIPLVFRFPGLRYPHAVVAVKHNDHWWLYVECQLGSLKNEKWKH